MTLGRTTALALLVLVYLFALASFDPLDVVAGVVVGAAALAVTARLPGRARARRPASWPRAVTGALLMTWATVRDISVGTWDVALVVLHLRPLHAPGIVAVPIGERSPAAVAVQGLLATLAPGEFLVDVDWERGVILVHVLDAGDPGAVRRRHQDFYERCQRAVVP